MTIYIYIHTHTHTYIHIDIETSPKGNAGTHAHNILPCYMYNRGTNAWALIIAGKRERVERKEHECIVGEALSHFPEGHIKYSRGPYVEPVPGTGRR